MTWYGPEGAPPVLLLHPWWGVTPSIIEWADILVGAGRRVLLPDLFDGRTADTPADAEALVRSIGSEAIHARAESAAAEVAAGEQPWAAVGFSLGAFHACSLAVVPDDLTLFYGGQPPVGRTARRVRLHVVEGDEYFTAEELAETETAFRATEADVDAYHYLNVGHWFAEPGSPAFDDAAFALARTRVLKQLGV